MNNFTLLFYFFSQGESLLYHFLSQKKTMMIMMMTISVKKHPKEVMQQSTIVYQGYLEIISIKVCFSLGKCCAECIH